MDLKQNDYSPPMIIANSFSFDETIIIKFNPMKKKYSCHYYESLQQNKKCRKFKYHLLFLLAKLFNGFLGKDKA